MPALVYLFGGWQVAHGGAARTTRSATLGAFTALQIRLFAPIGSLLSVAVDVQSSLALFDRIFEYLDLPIDIAPGDKTLDHVTGDVALDDVWFRYATAPTRSTGSTSRCRRDDHRDRRRDRRREDHARLPRLTALRRVQGCRAHRRRRRARPHLRLARRDGRRRLAGDVPLPRDASARTCASRSRTRPTRRSRRPPGRRRSTG